MLHQHKDSCSALAKRWKDNFWPQMSHSFTYPVGIQKLTLLLSLVGLTGRGWKDFEAPEDKV